MNGEGWDSGRSPRLPREPASPSAERSGCADLLSGVRDLHMTCPFVNLAPQLFASLHLCLPVLRTLQAPARGHLLSCSPCSPTHLSPPRATLVWVAALRWVPLPFLFPCGPPGSLPPAAAAAAAAAAPAAAAAAKPGKPAEAPWSSSRKCRVNSLPALPPRQLQTGEEVSHLQPLLLGNSALHRMEVEKENKMFKLLGCWDKLT